jgi:hypothetical protein
VIHLKNENPSFRKTAPYGNARFDPIAESMTGIPGKRSTRFESVQACNPVKYTGKNRKWETPVKPHRKPNHYIKAKTIPEGLRSGRMRKRRALQTPGRSAPLPTVNEKTYKRDDGSRRYRIGDRNDPAVSVLFRNRIRLMKLTWDGSVTQRARRGNIGCSRPRYNQDRRAGPAAG